MVNNDKGFGIHAFAGAFPPQLYLFPNTGMSSRPPYIPQGTAPEVYYGRLDWSRMGSLQHQAFIFNVAMGRLDLYGFGKRLGSSGAPPRSRTNTAHRRTHRHLEPQPV